MDGKKKDAGEDWAELLIKKQLSGLRITLGLSSCSDIRICFEKTKS